MAEPILPAESTLPVDLGPVNTRMLVEEILDSPEVSPLTRELDVKGLASRLEDARETQFALSPERSESRVAAGEMLFNYEDQLTKHAKTQGLTLQEYADAAAAQKFDLGDIYNEVVQKGVSRADVTKSYQAQKIPAMRPPQARKVAARGALIKEVGVSKLKLQGKPVPDALLPGKKIDDYRLETDDDEAESAVVKPGTAAYKDAARVLESLTDEDTKRGAAYTQYLADANSSMFQESGLSDFQDNIANYETNEWLKKQKAAGNDYSIMSAEYQQEYDKQRKQALKVAALAHTVNRWVSPMLVSWEDVVGMPKPDESDDSWVSRAWRRGSNVRLELIGSDARGVPVYRMTHPVMHVFEMSDALQSAAIGAFDRVVEGPKGESFLDAMSEGSLEGIKERRHALEYGMSTDLAKSGTSGAWTAGLSGLAVAVMFPDLFVGAAGVAKLGRAAAKGLAKIGVSSKATKLVKVTVDSLGTGAAHEAEAADHLMRAQEHLAAGSWDEADRAMAEAAAKMRQGEAVEQAVRRNTNPIAEMVDGTDMEMHLRQRRHVPETAPLKGEPLADQIPGAFGHNKENLHPSVRKSKSRGTLDQQLGGYPEFYNQSASIERLRESLKMVRDGQAEFIGPLSRQVVWPNRDNIVTALDRLGLSRPRLIDDPDAVGKVTALTDYIDSYEGVRVLARDSAAWGAEVRRLAEDLPLTDTQRVKLLGGPGEAGAITEAIAATQKSAKAFIAKKATVVADRAAMFAAIRRAAAAVEANIETRASSMALVRKVIADERGIKIEPIAARAASKFPEVRELSPMAQRYLPQIKDAFELTDDEALAAARILDMRARVWAAATERPEQEYFLETFPVEAFKNKDAFMKRLFKPPPPFVPHRVAAASLPDGYRIEQTENGWRVLDAADEVLGKDVDPLIAAAKAIDQLVKLGVMTRHAMDKSATRVGPLLLGQPLSVAENAIRKLNIEYAMVHTDDGVHLLRKTSNAPNYVSFTTSETLRMMKTPNVRFTHNHPSGGAFSGADMIYGSRLDARQMRATQPSGGVWILDAPQGFGELSDAVLIEKYGSAGAIPASVNAEKRSFYQEIDEAVNTAARIAGDNARRSNGEKALSRTDTEKAWSAFYSEELLGRPDANGVLRGGRLQEVFDRRGIDHTFTRLEPQDAGVRVGSGDEPTFGETARRAASERGLDIQFQQTAEPKQTGWEMKELADGLVELTSAEIRAARAAGAAPVEKLPEPTQLPGEDWRTFRRRVREETRVTEARLQWDELGTESPVFKEWSGGAPIVEKGGPIPDGPAVVPVFRGLRDVSWDFRKSQPGRTRGDKTHGSAIFASSNPETALTYTKGTGGVAPMYAKVDKIIELERKGYWKGRPEFSQTDLDRRASMLAPGEALVVRNAWNPGDTEELHRFGADFDEQALFGDDIWAFGNGTEFKPQDFLAGVQPVTKVTDAEGVKKLLADPARAAAKPPAAAAAKVVPPPSGFLDGSVYKDDLFVGTDDLVGTGHSLLPNLGGEYGIYLTPRRRYAQRYGDNLLRVKVSLKNPKYVADKSEISPRDLTKSDIELLIEQGHDGIVVTNKGIGEASEVVLFQPEQAWVHRISDTPGGPAAKITPVKTVETIGQDKITSSLFSLPGGKIKVVENSPGAGGAHSVVVFVVDKSARGQGMGSQLVGEVLRAYPDKEISAQVSSLASLKVFHNKGFRHQDMGMEFDDLAKLYKDEGGSLNMRRAKPAAAPAEEVMGAGLVFKVEDNVLRVQSVELPEAMRGKGVGTEMYMRALRHAKEKGFGFSSDVAPSPDAIAAYERLIEQGIPLTRKTVEAADGKMVQQFVMEADELRRVDLDAAKPDDSRILYQEAPRKSAVQVKAELDRARLVPDKVILGVLGGKRPEHLDGVIDFLTTQRQRVRAGEMTRRDIVKAWVMTVMSMQSGAIDATKLAQKLASQGLDIPLGADFIAPLRSGKPGIRPEEAAAAWLFSPDGQKFLDAMDGGVFDADAYKSLVAVRKSFGNAAATRNLGLPGKQMTLVDIEEIDALVSAINAAGKSGDTDAMSKAVLSMKGIGTGKEGFIKHLLGFGDSPTIDAVEINLWLTGRGDVGSLKTKSAQLARDVKNRFSSKVVSETIKRRITQRLKGLQKSGITEGVDDDIAPHILHHWLWDRAKDLETTHKGMYKAQVLAQEIDDELRGAMEFLENGRSVIYGLNKPNFATFIHEIGHVMRRDLSEVQMDTVVKWLNDTEGVSVSAKGGRFDGTAEMVTEAEEKFARAFEEYIRTGVAAKPSLKQVFEQMKQWLIGIYGSLSGLDVTVTPDIRKVFDELLGNEPAKQPFLRNIMKTVRDEITGDSLRNKGTRYNLFKDLARESRRLGHDISHVDLVKQFDESAAADAAARGVDKKDGLGKITLPGPVYMAGRFPEGKAEFAAADLVRLTEEVIGASLLAKAPGPRMALSARREAIKEMTPTQIIDNWVSSGEFAGVKKWVRSIYLGGDAVEDMRNLPEPIRRSIIAMPKELEQTVGDVIKLITTGDFDSTVAYITGDLVNFADSGRPAISSGHDMMGSVLMQMKRFFDPAQGPLTSAELNALIDFAESIHVHKGTLEYTQMRAKAELVTSALAKIKSDSAASPFISEVLKAAGVAPGRQLLPNIFGAPSKAGQPGSLIESLMYASGVSRRPPAGLGRATKQFDLQFLPAAQRMDSAHIFTQLYSDLVSPSLFKGDPKVANRVVVLIAGHGKAAKAMSTWAKMGIVTDAQTASAFKRWVSGEVVESEVDMLRVLQLYQVHGYSPNFVKGMDLYGLDLYVPKAARRRLSQALIRATDPSVSDLLKGDFLEAIGGGTAVTTDPLAMGLAWSYRYSKTRMVRGHFVMKSRYFTMNTFDHYNQMALVTGFRPAFVSTIRMMDQNAISNPLGQAVVVAAKKLGFPKAGEAIRKQLQKAGDKGAHWAGAILMGSKWRLEVNDILEGRRIVYSLGGNPTSAKVIRDVALQEGIFSSFDTAQLGTKIQKSLDLLLKQAKENDPDMALRLKRFLSLNDFPRVAADIAEAWSERERLGAMVTLMEMGIDARTAARITIDALYDYAGSMSKWDRHWLINLVLPFWAFQKNANRQIMDTVFSPKGAYRLGVMRRSYEHGLDLLSDMLYYDMVDEYGIDTENMSIELSDTYYGLKEALEEHYGSADAIPDDVRRDFETWVSGKMRAGALESSALFTGDKIKRLLMATGTLELSRYYVPKPAMSSRRTFRRDRPGLAVPHTYRENMRKWINGIRNNTPDTPYTFVMLPEPFYTAAFHHMGYTAATMILAAEGLVKAPLSLVTEGDSTDDLVQSMGVLGEVFSPQRAPVPSELLASYGLEKASYPQKLHPSLVAIAEASGIDTFATTPSEDPFTKEAERKDALEQGRPVAEFAGTIKEARYYMMPGIPRLLFVNTPIGELNSILMKSRVTPLEQAAAKGESILWARRVTGLDTEDVYPSRTVAGESRRARNEKGSEKVYDAARKGRQKRPGDK